MGAFLYVVLLLLGGLLVGGLARLALPGRDPLSLLQTMLVGIGGTLAAGLLWWLVTGQKGGGILLSVLIATGIVYLIRRSRGGTLTRPAPERDA